MRIRALLIACLLLIGAASSFHADWGWSNTPGIYPDPMNFNLTEGLKSMNGNDWAPVDEPVSVAFDWGYTRRDWPVGMTFALLYNDEEETEAGTDFSASSPEAYLGVRKNWYTRRQPWLSPYPGAGLLLAYATADASGAIDNDDSGFGLGGWTGGVFCVILYESINLGFDLRNSGTPTSYDDRTVDAGGFYAGLVIGYHLSARN